MRFVATIHEDQPERLAYAKRLRERLSALLSEHGPKKADEILAAGERDRLLADARTKWGDDYAKRLWSAEMKRSYIGYLAEHRA